MAKHSDSDAHMSSFHDVTLNATLADLKTLFPESYRSYGNLGDDKTNFFFTLENEDGEVFTIYDWKYYRPISLHEAIEWHIGGYGFSSEYKGKQEVEAMIADLHANKAEDNEVKRYTVEYRTIRVGTVEIDARSEEEATRFAENFIEHGETKDEDEGIFYNGNHIEQLNEEFTVDGVYPTPVEPAKFKEGDAVIWTDPDEGFGTGLYLVTKVINENGINSHYMLSDGKGEVEAYQHEMRGDSSDV